MEFSEMEDDKKHLLIKRNMKNTKNFLVEYIRYHKFCNFDQPLVSWASDHERLGEPISKSDKKLKRKSTHLFSLKRGKGKKSPEKKLKA